MAETFVQGKLTVSFVGPNAAQNKAMFLDIMEHSESFRNEIAYDASGYFRNIYVGTTSQDFEGTPNYSDYRVDRDQEGALTVASGGPFGRSGAPGDWYILLPGSERTAVLGDQEFATTPDLDMAHELMHPGIFAQNLSEGSGNRDIERS